MRPETESSPLPERWLPQTSIRFLIILIGLCALVMYTFRAAIVDDQVWAKIGSLVIATALACLVAYGGLFVVALLFSTAAGVVLRELTGRRKSVAAASISGDPKTRDSNPSDRSRSSSGDR